MAVGTAGLSSRPSAHRNMRWYAAATPAKPAPMMAILNGSGSPGAPSSEAVAAARDPPRAPRTHRLAPSSGGETGGRRERAGDCGAGPSRDAPRRSLGRERHRARDGGGAAAVAIASTRTGACVCPTVGGSSAFQWSRREISNQLREPWSLEFSATRAPARAEAARDCPAVGVTRGDASESAPGGDRRTAFARRVDRGPRRARSGRGDGYAEIMPEVGAVAQSTTMAVARRGAATRSSRFRSSGSRAVPRARALVPRPERTTPGRRVARAGATSGWRKPVEERTDAAVTVRVRRPCPGDLRVGLLGEGGGALGEWDTSRVNPMRRSQSDPDLWDGSRVRHRQPPAVQDRR